MGFMNTTSRIVFSLMLSCIATLALAQDAGPRGGFYRCKDAKGQAHFGSSMPSECQGFDTELVSSNGTIVRTIEGATTRARRLEQEEIQAKEIKEHNEQMQRDKVLIETYLSVAEIERLRDQRLDLLTAQLKVAEQHIATLRDRLLRLRQQSARFKPYSDKPNAGPLPDHLAEDLVGTVKSLAVDQETIDIKRNEQTTLSNNFERDIKRFKELKGIK